MNFRVVIFLILTVCLPALSIASVIKVPAEFSTIQAGINAAVQGDTVLVSDGTYTGIGNRDLDLKGKDMTVMSVNGPESCVIDCIGDDYDYGFHCYSDESSTARIEGFSILNTCKAGIYCEWSSPTVSNCIIRSSLSRGIIIKDSTSSISNCVIMNNSGGGLKIESADVTITNCTISNNSTEVDGAGIFLSSSSARIMDCAIEHNQVLVSHNSYNDGSGGGIYSISSSISISECLINGNSAYKAGGGIYLSHEKNNTANVISDCLFSDNISLMGGGIYCIFSISPVIGGSAEQANEFKNNIAAAGADLCTDPDSEIVTASFNHFSGNHLSDYYVSPQNRFDLSDCTSNQEPVRVDVYVSPEGNDNNNGLAPDTPYKTIMHAAKKAVGEETNPITIHLAPGVYSASETGEIYPLPFLDHVNIEGDESGSVILDAEQNVCVFYGLLDTAAISGLTITGAKNHGIVSRRCTLELMNCCIRDNKHLNQRSEDGNGGGINMEDSDLSIIHCVIENNEATAGGGIYCWDSSEDAHPRLYMENCILQNNQCSEYGGGLKNECRFQNIKVEITGCTIANNIGSRGGGIYSSGSHDNPLMVSYSSIINNQASEGGGINMQFGSAILEGCSISGNIGTNHGSAIYSLISTFSKAILRNCVISDNSSANNTVNMDNLLTENCTFVRNISSAEDAACICTSVNNDQITEIVNCILWANAATEIRAYSYDGVYNLKVEHCCIMNGFPGDGNFSMDPRFQGNTDFHLRGDSPCVDAGTDKYAPATDLDGNERPQGGGMDIGAYEFAGWPEVPRTHIEMLNRNPGPGDMTSCTVSVWNPGPSKLTGYPLFVILDIFGAYFCAPDFSDFDYYNLPFPEGSTPVTVLDEFQWPHGAGSLWGAVWYSALTNPQMNALYGNLDTMTFGWHE